MHRAIHDLLKKFGLSRTDNDFQQNLVATLAVIAASVVVSQIVSFWMLAGQAQALHVVNVAAGQRTLCQKIVKDAYRLMSVGSTESRRNVQEDLSDALARFQRAQSGLQLGDEAQNLPGHNPERIALMYSTLEPDFQSITEGAKAVLANVDQPGAALYQAVQKLSVHEAAFLDGMAAIVNAHESQAASRIGVARWTGVLVATIMLGLLAAVTLKVLMPLVRRLQNSLHEHEDREKEMDKVFSRGPGALFLVDATSLAIERINLKAEVLMGCSADDVVGRPISSYFDGRLETNKLFLQRIRIGEIFDEVPLLLVDARQNAVDVLASMRKVTYLGLRRHLISLTDVSAVKNHKG